MQVVEWSFGFHSPATPRQIWNGAPKWSFMGHVEAWGYTDDQNWVSFDPRSGSCNIQIMHMNDDVIEFLASRVETCSEIYRTSHRQQIRFPIHATMNCVTQCAALIGLRAFTPPGFRRKLLKTGAEKIHGKSFRRSRGEA